MIRPRSARRKTVPLTALVLGALAFAMALLDHAEEFDTTKIPVTLQPGDNHLLIKTNNRQNRERHLWALRCALE